MEIENLKLLEKEKGVDSKSIPFPHIADYQDYRLFLNNFYEYKHSINPAFSKRRFAQIAGFKSPNYLQLIVEGKRNLLEDTALELADGFKMSSSEKEIFISLVKKDLAKTEKEKAQAEHLRLLAIKKLVSKQMPTDQIRVLSEWYHLPVRELVQLKDFCADGDWISEKLFDLITPEQAMQSLELLQKAGFVTVKEGRHTLTEPVLTLETTRFQGVLFKKYQVDTLKIWSQHFEKMSDQNKEAIVLNVPINSNKIPELKKRMDGFIDELIGWLQDEKDADQVIQIGSHIVPYK